MDKNRLPRAAGWAAYVSGGTMILGLFKLVLLLTVLEALHVIA